ncbi:hypothetical protein GCM10023333_09900 [Ferrimonas pelagia]|uniref:Uncharacterized protein n=2 Tax=Ferrimonas pelagia TaxID=1177826 RepID=A0ABP9EGC6_9GAMM
MTLAAVLISSGSAMACETVSFTDPADGSALVTARVCQRISSDGQFATVAWMNDTAEPLYLSYRAQCGDQRNGGGGEVVADGRFGERQALGLCREAWSRLKLDYVLITQY